MAYLKEIEGMKALGNRLRVIRKAKGLSQEELANLCELPTSQISRIETGAINTSVSHIFLIARCLGIRPKELFDFEL